MRSRPSAGRIPTFPCWTSGSRTSWAICPRVVERVYAHAGMTLTDAARADMLRWDAENAMHKHGAFTYSLDDVGLDEREIRQRMSDYFAFLDQLAGPAAAGRPAA